MAHYTATVKTPSLEDVLIIQIKADSRVAAMERLIRELPALSKILSCNVIEPEGWIPTKPTLVTRKFFEGV